ncbi:hypothetical protein [Halarchaeum sp. P4]|uniref:hypothetical protein n=1 Tax=Halarchaeum sp. P4 TaxID=3421639 RepID=UPI003EB799F4
MEPRLEFADLDAAFERNERRERRQREFRFMFIGLCAGVLANIPAQLLVQPFHVSDSGVVMYGDRVITQTLPTPRLLLLNGVVLVAMLVACLYGYRYYTGYYDEPTVRVPFDSDSDTVYDHVEEYLSTEAEDLDVDVVTGHQRIQCVSPADEDLLSVEFDPGRDVAYVTWDPHDRQSRVLVEKLRQRFGK